MMKRLTFSQRREALEVKLERLRTEIEKHSKTTYTRGKMGRKLDSDIKVAITSGTLRVLESEIVNEEDSTMLKLFGLPVEIVTGIGDEIYLIIKI